MRINLLPHYERLFTKNCLCYVYAAETLSELFIFAQKSQILDLFGLSGENKMGLIEVKSRWGKMWCQFIVPSLDFRSSFLLFLFSLIISHLLDTLAWKLTRFWVVFRRFSLFVSISKITLRLKVVVWFKYKVIFGLRSKGYSYGPEKDVCTS